MLAARVERRTPSRSVRSRMYPGRRRLGLERIEEFNLRGVLIFMEGQPKLFQRRMLAAGKALLCERSVQTVDLQMQGIGRLIPILFRLRTRSHPASLDTQAPLLQPFSDLLAPGNSTEPPGSTSGLVFVVQKHGTVACVQILRGDLLDSHPPRRRISAPKRGTNKINARTSEDFSFRNK